MTNTLSDNVVYFHKIICLGVLMPLRMKHKVNDEFEYKQFVTVLTYI